MIDTGGRAVTVHRWSRVAAIVGFVLALLLLVSSDIEPYRLTAVPRRESIKEWTFVPVPEGGTL